MKIFKVFKGKVREKNVRVVGYPVSWAPCCETWLKFEVTGVKVAIAKKI